MLQAGANFWSEVCIYDKAILYNFTAHEIGRITQDDYNFTCFVGGGTLWCSSYPQALVSKKLSNLQGILLASLCALEQGLHYRSVAESLGKNCEVFSGSSLGRTPLSDLKTNSLISRNRRRCKLLAGTTIAEARPAILYCNLKHLRRYGVGQSSRKGLR